MFAIALLGMSIYFLLASFSWVLESALFPRTASIAALTLLTLYFANRTLRRVEDGGAAQLMDIGRIRSDLPTSLVRRRLGLSALSIVALVGCIWLFGFHVAIPVYVFLYEWLVGRMRWWFALIPAILFEVLLIQFYDRMLYTTWHTPILFPFLGS
jgi:hypothetical protein